jgi:thioredoxin 1
VPAQTVQFQRKIKNSDIQILKVNIDRNPEAAARYSVRSVPTLLLFQNGTIRWRQSGAHSAVQLQQIIQTHLTS